MSVQHGHGVACDGYEVLPVRTGYEEIIGHRTGDLFCTSARQDGVVKSIDENGIVVEYVDGTTKGIELGRRYGEAAGLTVPHQVKTNLKVGQHFKEGDNLAYNEGFFSKSPDDPTQMVWKGAALAWVALLESTKTLEDASSISHRIANLLTASSTKTVDILVPFDYEVHKVRKIGEAVDTEDILCIIEDAVTSASGAFDEESLDTLRAVSAQIPLAKAKGVVERLEVFYHGDREDMSKTLQTLTAQTDREMSKRYKAHGRPGFTGSTDESFRVDGEPLGLDMAVLRFYITGRMPMSIGDKAVIANQMKTVVSEVFDGDIKTESGKSIDVIFGQKSIDDRIVLSAPIIGTTTTLLDEVANLMVAAYRRVPV